MVRTLVLDRISLLLVTSTLILFCHLAETSPRRLHYKITEGRGSRSQIANIAQELGIAENSPSNRFRLSSTTRAITDLFRVDETTSELSTVSEIDRDSLCQRHKLCCEPEGSRTTDPCTLAFKITFSSEDGRFSFCLVEISIEDINDGSPQFAISHITLDIPESASVGTQFTLPRARDTDGGVNGVQSYRIDGGNGLFLVRAHRINGGELVPRLELNERLDRETTSQYQVVLIAADGGSPPRSGTVRVNIRVEDTNDNSPEVDPAISITVKEDTPVGSVIGRVEATDSDAGDNSRLTYRKTDAASDAVNRLFQVDTNTGELRLISRLDYDIGPKTYTVPVLVTDNGKPERSATTSVVVRLLDVNDEAPEITIMDLQSRFPPQPEVLENKPADTFVAFVSVRDLDSGASGNVNCAVNSRDFRLVSMDGLSLGSSRVIEYKLVTTRPLDREYPQYQKYRASLTVIIECQDNGVPQKISSKEVTVKILDENDNAPKFTAASLNISIMENKAVGTYVGQINATDADSDLRRNGLTFAMDETGIKYFRIDPHSGRLYTLRIFDREALPRFQFQVTVTDSGKPARTTSALVTVHILDENDCTPQFQRKVFQFSTNEGQPAKQLVGVLVVTDGDAGANGRFLLQIDDARGIAQRTFELDSRSGKLYTRRTLNRETQSHYTFQVSAIDRGVSRQHSSQAKVKVTVNDINDNKPKFVYPTKQNHTVICSVYNPQGTPLVKLTAMDEDINDNGAILFLITRGNERGLFDLDPKTGEMTLTHDLKESDAGNYLLHLEVRDNGSPALSSAATITVVLDTSPARELPTGYGPANRRRHGSGGYFGQFGSDRNLVVVICLVVIATVLAVIFLFIIVWLKRKPAVNGGGSGWRHGNGGRGLRRAGDGSGCGVGAAMMLHADSREKREIRLAGLQTGSRSTLPLKGLLSDSSCGIKDGFGTVKFGHPSVVNLSDDPGDTSSLQSFGCRASIDSGRGGSHDQLSTAHKQCSGISGGTLTMLKETNGNCRSLLDKSIIYWNNVSPDYHQITCPADDTPPAYTGLPPPPTLTTGTFRTLGGGRRNQAESSGGVSLSREKGLDSDDGGGGDVGNYQTLKPVSTFPSLKVTVTTSNAGESGGCGSTTDHPRAGTLHFKPVSSTYGGGKSDYSTTTGGKMGGSGTCGRKPYSVYTSSFV